MQKLLFFLNNCVFFQDTDMNLLWLLIRIFIESIHHSWNENFLTILYVYGKEIFSFTLDTDNPPPHPPILNSFPGGRFR